MDETKSNSGTSHTTHRSKPIRVKGSESEQSNTRDLELLKAELETAQKGCAANLDGWQRERAEFSNYKKLVDRDRALQKQNITGETIMKYLVVILDDLELALKSRPTDGDGAAWSAGVELVVRKIYTILEVEGIDRININNVPFDPNIHQAISNEDDSGFESGNVIEVVRQGFKIGERILRPAMVRVAR